MKTLGYLLLGTALCLSPWLMAQSGDAAEQAQWDSLYAAWLDRAQTDSARTEAYYSYIRKKYLDSDPDSAFVLAQALVDFGKKRNIPLATIQGVRLQGSSMENLGEYTRALELFTVALEEAERVSNKTLMANLYLNRGNMYYYLGEFPKAVAQYQQSLPLFQELASERDIGGVLMNIGTIYYNQGLFTHAQENYLLSLKSAERRNDTLAIADALLNIGNVYSEQKDNHRAIEYVERGLGLYRSIGHKRGIGMALTNLASSYVPLREYDKALDYSRQGMAIDQELGDENAVTRSLWHIGNSYLGLNQLDSALAYHQRSLALAQKLENKNNIVLAQVSIGNDHLNLGQPALAIPVCQQALEVSTEIQALGIIRDACDCLYEANKLLGNFPQALRFHEQYLALNDSMYNRGTTEKLTQLGMQYDFDKQEAEARAEQEKKDAVAAQVLRRQKMVRNGFMGGFAVVMLFAGVFLSQRNRISKEKARSEELLLNILPEEVADELKQKGEAEAAQVEQVTVLFTDFKGFTALSEQLSPKELVKDLHACFSLFDGITEKYGIEKIKTIGDAYMAAGGLPTPNNTHAHDVIRAALEMRDVVEEGKARKIAAGLPYFEIRIGLHTGPVVAGIVGVKKFQYDIWGDTVNTASRMESSGEVGRVNISEATYQLARHLPGFAFTARGQVHAKGKGEMHMYFVDRLEA